MVSINATLIAQILNFIVLLWVLAKFAYKPLIKAMDDRRNRIINDLDTAEQTRLDAEALKAQYVEQLANARQEATDIVDKANKVAQNLHDEFMMIHRLKLLITGLFIDRLHALTNNRQLPKFWKPALKL